jgi:xylose isomerase
MDVLAKSLLAAHAMLADGALEKSRSERYAAWDTQFGRSLLAGEQSLSDLHRHVLDQELDPAPVSGRQEALESIVNRYIERIG